MSRPSCRSSYWTNSAILQKATNWFTNTYPNNLNFKIIASTESESIVFTFDVNLWDETYKLHYYSIFF